MTVCNCQKQTLKGIIDFADPNYCDSQHLEIAPIQGTYDFLTKNTVEWTAKGYLCLHWIREKSITGHFFGSYDCLSHDG